MELKPGKETLFNKRAWVSTQEKAHLGSGAGLSPGVRAGRMPRRAGKQTG